MRIRIAAAMAAPADALSYLCGDFNYVVCPGDRRSLTTLDDTGARNQSEQAHFVSRIQTPFQFVEMLQEAMRYQGGRAHSRLDRIDCNHHIVDQLDRHLQVVALPWDAYCSDHRPVSFRQVTPTKSGNIGISVSALKH